MNEREQIKRAIFLLPKLATELESKEIKADIDLLMGVTLQLTAELTNRNDALAKQCRPPKSKPTKASPAKAPQQPKRPPSSADTPDRQNDSKDRPKELSSIQQGIRQADVSLDDQQRNLRHFTYGQNDDERSFRIAAKAIAS